MKKQARVGRPPTGRALTAAERMRRYRARQKDAGLRAVIRWQSAEAPLPTPGILKHRQIEARSLAMHCVIAAKIAAAPELLDIARRNLAKWSERYGENVPPALLEWASILEQSWPHIAALITDPRERATRLRQSTPFAGILTDAERRRIYDAFRA